MQKLIALGVVVGAIGVSGHAGAQKKDPTPSPQLKIPGALPSNLAQQAGASALQNARKAQLAEEEKALRASADRVRPSLAQAITKTGYDIKGLEARIAECQKQPFGPAMDKCARAIIGAEKARIPSLYKTSGLDLAKERSALTSALKLPSAAPIANKKLVIPTDVLDNGDTMGVDSEEPFIPIAPILPSSQRDVKNAPFSKLPAPEGGGDYEVRDGATWMWTACGAGGASAWYQRVSMSTTSVVNLNMRRVQVRSRFRYYSRLWVLVGLLGYASGEIKVTLHVKRNGVDVCTREKSLDHLFAPVLASYDHNDSMGAGGAPNETELSCSVEHDNRFPQYTAQLDLETWAGAGGFGFVTAGGMVEPVSFTFESTATPPPAR